MLSIWRKRVRQEQKAGKSVAHCSCDREIKRAAPGLPFSEKKSIGISQAIHNCNKSRLEWIAREQVLTTVF